jgi:hypothetical protein
LRGYHVPNAQNFPARDAGSAMKGVRHATSAKTVKDARITILGFPASERGGQNSQELHPSFAN